MDMLHPTTIDELREAVAQAIAGGRPLDVRGGGSKRGLGRPTNSDAVLALDCLSGIVDYDRAGLVLTAQAGTPLAEIQQALAEHRQMLAFEPPDWRGLLGADS